MTKPPHQEIGDFINLKYKGSSFVLVIVNNNDPQDLKYVSNLSRPEGVSHLKLASKKFKKKPNSKILNFNHQTK